MAALAPLLPVPGMANDMRLCMYRPVVVAAAQCNRCVYQLRTIDSIAAEGTPHTAGLQAFRHAGSPQQTADSRQQTRRRSLPPTVRERTFTANGRLSLVILAAMSLWDAPGYAPTSPRGCSLVSLNRRARSPLAGSTPAAPPSVTTSSTTMMLTRSWQLCAPSPALAPPSMSPL